LDLLQVEGLADVLSSETAGQRRLAMRQFLGEASSIYERWRADLLRALALVEAAIDFSEEDDVAERAVEESRVAVDFLASAFESALQQADRTSAVRRGLRVVLAGAPNVGKSSLLNWLAGRDTAIVSPVAGTTRDVVEAPLVLGGVPIIVSDTAGLRSGSVDEIEREGMRRTRRAVDEADILVWVTSTDSESDLVWPRVPEVVVLNKVDREDGPVRHVKAEVVWPVSVKTGKGLEALQQGLMNLIRDRNQLGEDAVVVRERHRQALQQALVHLHGARVAAERGLEFVAEDMRKAAQVLAGVTGRVDVEDLLGHIFKDFCIGK
ncbi:MAG: GTP-binding protein, partial [Phyllobacteriaceae bacterium]|nr:GTP-binding protein [Phyllobacteriaceae bacterium]